MTLGKKGEGIVRRRQSFGRKRVVLSSALQIDDFITGTETSKHCREVSFPSSEKPSLESLPQDVLIRIIFGVDHDDLSRLFHVSKTIREVTMIAKKWHFEYSTPRKTMDSQNVVVGFEDSMDYNEVEAPNAPRQTRVPKLRLSHKKLSGIAVALFP
ncbi:PREDICTED: F-box protein At1g61340-like [Ipomoea nil]|uniref:F-box protein At1g61340-like n=1 Tax=Ipomoea nil TaxID=35883 RepID=UPI000901FF3A|nr:PREDICTED: F-box protein At1g61340-like [Ipomoea nil]